jgi:hypothetical protein
MYGWGLKKSRVKSLWSPAPHANELVNHCCCMLPLELRLDHSVSWQVAMATADLVAAQAGPFEFPDFRRVGDS